ncbi:MAG: signal peptidase I [Patescibacteria group bacterium]
MAYVPDTVGELKKFNFIGASGKNIWSFFVSLSWLVLIGLFLLKLFVYQQVTVIGESMEPSYQTDQLLLVDQVNKNFKRGQVVAVYEDKEVAKTADYWTRFKTRFFLKRVIGLPGEEIQMVGDKVIIYNEEFPEGKVLDEDYVSKEVKSQEEILRYYFPRTKIQDNDYFVMGDNRLNSLDSRERGTFPDYALFGQETLRFWPLRDATLFSLPEYSYSDIDEELKAKIEYLEITQNN